MPFVQSFVYRVTVKSARKEDDLKLYFASVPTPEEVIERLESERDSLGTFDEFLGHKRYSDWEQDRIVWLACLIQVVKHGPRSLAFERPRTDSSWYPLSVAGVDIGSVEIAVFTVNTRLAATTGHDGEPGPYRKPVNAEELIAAHGHLVASGECTLGNNQSDQAQVAAQVQSGDVVILKGDNQFNKMTVGRIDGAIGSAARP